MDERFSLKDGIQEDVDDERGNIFKTINKQKTSQLYNNEWQVEFNFPDKERPINERWGHILLFIKYEMILKIIINSFEVLEYENLFYIYNFLEDFSTR